jgi:hypothetical protein
MVGRMTMAPGMEAPMKVIFKRPLKIRIEFVVQGMTGIQAFDGTTAWMLMPFYGQTQPAALAGEQAQNLIDQADFDGPLVDWKEKGHQVELQGQETVDGKEAFKLKITLKGGATRFHYLDKATFLTFRQDGKAAVQGTEVEMQSFIGDYRQVGDLKLPHSFENRQVGAPSGQKITFERIEINVDILDDEFAMPQ